MLLWFTAYILIPVYTIMFVQGNNWFTTNFSVIGNQLGRQEAFVLWGLLVGIYFFFSLRVIVVQMAVPPKSTWLIPLALFLLPCAVITPYLPEILPLRSTLHIVFSFMAALCLILSIGSILLRLYQDDRKKYRPYLIGLAGIAMISLFLLLLAGIISSALEIFFTITSVLLVRRLYLTLQ